MDTDLNGTVAVPSGSMTFNSNIAFAGTFELKSGTLFLPVRYTLPPEISGLVHYDGPQTAEVT